LCCAPISPPTGGSPMSRWTSPRAIPISTAPPPTQSAAGSSSPAGAAASPSACGCACPSSSSSNETNARMKWLAPFVVLVLAAPAGAQTTSPASPPPLPPVRGGDTRVPEDRTAIPEQAREEIERTPGGVGIVTQEQIEETRAANLKDALEWVPGVRIRPRFGAADESQLSIRGSGLRNNFHLRGINVLIDGFPYGNADGFSDFESLELLATKRIEVFKGANALRFGANTMGGAINLVTKTGAD